MRPLPQVTDCGAGYRGYGQAEVPEGGTIGSNLFMCIPPDHQRNDLPSAVSLQDVCMKLSPFPWKNSAAKMYVRITDDLGSTVTLPCCGIEDCEGGFALVAHSTGRPIA